MKEKVYVERLFADYEDSPEIRDFKEEIVANFAERVKELVSTGLDEEKAFEKAAAELGDITAIADEVGKKKRNEAIGQMYIGAKMSVSKRTAIGLALATGLLLLAVGTALLAFFGTSESAAPYYLAAFLLASALGTYTFFGLTWESATHYAMKNGRALAYGFACLLGFLGAGLAVVSFLLDGFAMSAALGLKMALLLPAICALVFLGLTESDRQKPWLRAIVEREREESLQNHAEIVNPVKAAKFGVTSVALWILAVGVFLTIGFAIGWQYAWLAFVFALALQMFMVTTIFEKKNYKSHPNQ
jgi:MFS family permease